MSKRPPKKARIQPIRHEEVENAVTESAVAVEDPPEQPQQAAEPAQPPKKGRGRPPGRESNPVRTQLTFFQRVDKIELADWGTRAKVKVYRLQPIIDQTRGSEFKFIQIYEEPVDENKIKIDHGSGRYRLYLNVKNAGEQTEKEIDMMEFDILDPRFPPNIPAGHWKDDNRNKKWVWAMPPGAPGGPPIPEPPQAVAAAAAASTFSDAIKTYDQIRSNVKAEFVPATAPAPTSDPLTQGLQIAQMIMSTKADNPMVEIMKEQLRAQNESNEKSREREAALQKELREMNRRPPGDEKRFGLREAIGELKEFLPAIKEFLPQAVESARASRSSWLDVARDVAPGVIDWGGKIALALASRMPPPPPAPQNGQPRPQIAAPANGAQPQQQPQAPPQEPPAFVRFLGQPFVFDGFQRYFRGYKEGNNTGADFAEWINDGGGEVPLKEGRAMGSTGIMQMLKQSPAWFLFKDDEAKLTAFVDETLAWAPPSEDPDDDGEDDDDDVVDLTKKGV